jgi:hypothetical protein
MNQFIADDYEACETCGFDHSYESNLANERHKDLAVQKEREAFDKAQKILDAMDDNQVAATWQALCRVEDFHEGASYNGLTGIQWSELVYSEWDRRGGSWKTWAGNKSFHKAASFSPDIDDIDSAMMRIPE